MLVLSLVLALSAFGFVLLRGAVGLYDASREVERAEFGAYVRSLHLRSTYPSLLGLGYAARVGPATVDDLEARVQGDGEPGFRVWPAPTSADDAAVVYLEPRDQGNRRAIGFTMSQEPARRAAMDRARDAGVGAVSASVDLFDDASSTLGGVLVSRGLGESRAISRSASTTGPIRSSPRSPTATPRRKLAVHGVPVASAASHASSVVRRSST
jgi:hypothetical protein